MYSAPKPSWDTIGSGYESSNIHRWEAVDVNGWCVLNNGLNLPVTYRAGDAAVKPIYELRELGIACVGTIAIHAGILCCMDVTEIQEEKLDELFEWAGVQLSGQITATQADNTVTASDDFFSADHIGMILQYSDGVRRMITTYISPEQVVVDGAALTKSTGLAFKLYPRASQAGSTYSDTKTASMVSGSKTVTASSAIFDNTMEGQWVYFADGFHKKIATYTDPTHVELDTAADHAITSQKFFIVNDATSYRVTSTTDVFTSSMVGQSIVWVEDGTTRKITGFTDARTVTVDSFVSVPIGRIGIENSATYAPYLEKQFCNRYQYRFINSAIGEPRRWGALVTGSIEADSNILRLDYPLKSLEIGHQILVVGAGISGGNLTTTITNSLGLGSILVLGTKASTTVTSASVMRSDVQGSIMGGANDLYDDGSTILRAQDLRGSLVIYRDTSIFLGRYTGDATIPFEFKKITVPEGSTLYYPYTLTEVNGEYHFYAGRRAFWTFDLTTQVPKLVEMADQCKDLFFGRVDAADRFTDVYAANNEIEQEVMLQFPSSYSDKGICFDYRHGMASTTSAAYTAAEMCKMPGTNDSQDVFVLGTENGVLLEYGKLDQPNGVWAGDREIYWRRDANPYSVTPYAYASVLQSGLSDMSVPYHEKTFLAWLLLLASQEAQMPYVKILFELLKARNVSENPSTALRHWITNPKSENLIPLLSQNHCFADRITVSYAAPCRISARVWEILGARTKSTTRREHTGT